MREIEKKSTRYLVRAVLSLLLALSLFLVCYYTHYEGVSSAKASRSVAHTVAQTVHRDFEALPKQRQSELVSIWNTVVRETGHAVQFFPIGALAALLLLTFAVFAKHPVYTLLLCAGFCLLFGVGDEIHQLFTDGRSFEVRDFLLDALGGTVGAAIAAWACHMGNQIAKKRKERA